VRRLTVLRFEDDRGAVAIAISLLMVVLLGFGAISIDVGRLYAERRSLQNGADAAALAVAQETGCSAAAASPGSSTAQTLATANDTGGPAVASTPVFQTDPTHRPTVTVTVHAVGADGQPGRANLLAPVLGSQFTRSAVAATATATCGHPGAGTAALPLTFHQCNFVAPAASQTPIIIGYNTTATRCNGVTGNVAPGNFGWLAGAGGGCAAAINPAVPYTPGDTGISIPEPCKPTLATLRGTVALIPMYDQATGTGSSVSFHIVGFAAFKITGYRFSGNPEFNWQNDIPGQPSCTGNCRAIIGTFVNTVALDQATTTPVGANFGVTVVSLTG
jgi:Flp pilus assembly protein TadG